MRSNLHRFDMRFKKLLDRFPDWIRIPMLFMTFLGQPLITLSVGTFIIGIGFGKNSPELAMSGVVAVCTLLIGSLLKLILRRERPATEYVEHMFLDTFSFPSGHAAGTVPVFGLAAYLIAGLNVWWSLPVVIIISLLTFFIGISRVYLGAHYASDVLGGWLIGLLGLAVIVCVIQPVL